MSLSARFAKLHNDASSVGSGNRKFSTAKGQKDRRGSGMNQRRGIQTATPTKKRPVIDPKKNKKGVNSVKAKVAGKKAGKGPAGKGPAGKNGKGKGKMTICYFCTFVCLDLL